VRGIKPERIRSREEFLAKVTEGFGQIEPMNAEECTRAVFAVLDRHIPDGEMADVRQVLPEPIRSLFSEPGRHARRLAIPPASWKHPGRVRGRPSGRGREANCVAVEFNHTIVAARDSAAAARFLADILGLDAPAAWGPFHAVTTANRANIDFMTVGG
jgi:hypothetical protein